MQPIPTAGKHVASAKRGKTCNQFQGRSKGGKTCNRCQVRVIMQLVSSAGNRATDTKRGKTCNRYQARENVQPIPNEGRKHVITSKLGKCSGCQVREIMQPSAGKHVISSRRGKTCNRCQAREVMLLVPRAGKQIGKTYNWFRPRQPRENMNAVLNEGGFEGITVIVVSS